MIEIIVKNGRIRGFVVSVSRSYEPEKGVVEIERRDEFTYECIGEGSIIFNDAKDVEIVEANCEYEIRK